jgi:hypothetical protein
MRAGHVFRKTFAFWIAVGRRELAALARVCLSTIVRLQSAGWDVAPGNAKTVARVVNALEQRHIEFIEYGVRLTKKPKR